MATIAKTVRDQLKRELGDRYANLSRLLEGRDLTSATDGAKKGHWRYPEVLCHIEDMAIHLALKDFKTILDEIAKIVK